MLTIEKSEATEKVIEKSRFISYSTHAESEEEARAFLAALQKSHPFATHICYAFICDKQGNAQRFSDNGEPQGTAGMPILENLKNHALVQSALAVVRYFGGVKLGAGGLTRAYFSAAKEHLEKARFSEILPCETW
ncbi:MAG: IMPACT family protein, partial [Candidatus Scatosoma sp.]